MRFGVLHTDQGSIFREPTQLRTIHRGIGKERSHQVKADKISEYCVEKPRISDVILPNVIFVYNTRVLKITRTTNFSLVNREANDTRSFFYSKANKNEYTEASDFTTWLYKTFQEAQGHARFKLRITQPHRKKKYHKKVQGKPYQRGTQIWLLSTLKAKHRDLSSRGRGLSW